MPFSSRIDERRDPGRARLRVASKTWAQTSRGIAGGGRRARDAARVGPASCRSPLTVRSEMIAEDQGEVFGAPLAFVQRFLAIEEQRDGKRRREEKIDREQKNSNGVREAGPSAGGRCEMCDLSGGHLVLAAGALRGTLCGSESLYRQRRAANRRPRRDAISGDYLSAVGGRRARDRHDGLAVEHQFAVDAGLAVQPHHAPFRRSVRPPRP